MTRQVTGWVTQEDRADLDWLHDAIVNAKPGMCAFCGAAQADDVRWPVGLLEGRDTADELTTDKYPFLTCPACEPKILAAMETMR